MSFTLPDLPYAHDALGPYMSKETLEYHHDKHHQAYVTNGNNLLKDSDLKGKSIEEIMRSKGFKTRVLRQLSIADGINAVRTLFPQLYFDAKMCADGLQYLRRYQWGPTTALGVARREPLHDDASHPADALRTLAVGIKEPERPKIKPKAAPQRQSPWS